MRLYSRPTEIPYIRSSYCIFFTFSAVKVAIESFHLLWVLIKCTARRVILSQFGVACLSKGLCHFLEIRASTTYTVQQTSIRFFFPGSRLFFLGVPDNPPYCTNNVVDPDPAFYLNGDPDPGCHSNPDPDLDHGETCRRKKLHV